MVLDCIDSGSLPLFLSLCALHDTGRTNGTFNICIEGLF